MILVLGPILAAAQREQLSEDSFTTDADEYGGQKYHDQGETGSQNLMFVICICWEFLTLPISVHQVLGVLQPQHSRRQWVRECCQGDKNM